MPDRVRITDVSPRDGLQNEPGVIPAEGKARLVRLLAAAGVDEVEVTSFVSAKWVPQLGDAAEVFRLLCLPRPEGGGRGEGAANTPATRPVFSALVPNERGLQGALEVNQAAGDRLISKISVFTAASETFARKNTNATIAETIDRFGPVVRDAHRAGLLVRGYISCIVACPFEGPVAPAAVVEVAHRLADLGVDELDLGDTIGVATPDTMAAVLEAVGRRWPLDGESLPITLHLHDTFGRAAACVRRGLDLGLRSFDGSAAGLGGCPYASTPDKRAPGNIATETLVRAVHDAGFRTNVDADALVAASVFAAGLVGRPASGDPRGADDQ